MFHLCAGKQAGPYHIVERGKEFLCEGTLRVASVQFFIFEHIEKNLSIDDQRFIGDRIESGLGLRTFEHDGTELAMIARIEIPIVDIPRQHQLVHAREQFIIAPIADDAQCRLPNVGSLIDAVKIRLHNAERHREILRRAFAQPIEFQDEQKGIIEQLLVERCGDANAFAVFIVAKVRAAVLRPVAEIDRAFQQRVNFGKVNGFLDQRRPQAIARPQAFAFVGIDRDGFGLDFEIAIAADEIAAEPLA